MKKVLASLLISAFAVSAYADYNPNHHPRHVTNSMPKTGGWVGPQHHYHHHRHNNWNWVVPAVIGGAVVYAATRPDPVVVQNPPQVIVQPQDIVYINGIAYRKQIMVINGQTQEVLVRI